jgi:hypothetical protein
MGTPSSGSIPWVWRAALATTPAEVRDLLLIVRNNEQMLMGAWHGYFGTASS